MFVGVDIGTSSTKGVLIGESGNDVTVTRRYEMVHPTPGRGEIDSRVVREAFFSCIAELGTHARDRGERIRAIAVSASGNEPTPVDTRGKALAPTIASMDSRGERALQQYLEDVGISTIRERTGLTPHVMHSLSRLLWLKDAEPEVFANTSSFLCWGDLAATWLGLPPTIDHSMAAWSMGFDPRSAQWDGDLIERAGVDPQVFPAAVPSGTVIGVIPDAVADEIGLDHGVQLVAGGFDQAMTAAGLGALAAGDAAMSAGTWEALVLVGRGYQDTEVASEAGFTTGPYVVGDGLFYTVANNPGGSAVVTWALDTLGQQERSEYPDDPGRAAGLLISRATSDPTELIVLPHHAGAYNPWMAPNALGAVYGLSLSTSRNDLVKGVLEGITYELRSNLERLEDLSAIPSLIVGGGGSRSPEWMQLRADILGRPLVSVAIEEPGAIAAAAIAAAAIGAVTTPGELIEPRLSRGMVTYEPTPDTSARYDELFQRYEQFYRAAATLRTA